MKKIDGIPVRKNFLEFIAKEFNTRKNVMNIFRYSLGVFLDILILNFNLKYPHLLVLVSNQKIYSKVSYWKICKYY